MGDTANAGANTAGTDVKKDEGNDELEREDKENAPSVKARIRRNAWRALIGLSYLAGIVWTCLHPNFSVLTGESKCRGWYIDEHALEMHFVPPTSFDTPAHLAHFQLPPLEAEPSNSDSSFSLCDYFNETRTKNMEDKYIPRQSNLQCIRRNSFHVARLVPLSSAIEPTDEAIVLVIPTVKDWRKSRFQDSMFKLIQTRLSQVPWLAKTIMFVTQATPEHKLEDAVDDFLDSYLGPHNQEQSIEDPLPPYFCSAMIRSLIVLDADDGNLDPALRNAEVPRTTLEILPQGRRGLLPNMDLVFLIGKMFQKASFTSSSKYPNYAKTHPYTKEQAQFVESHVSKLLNKIYPNPSPAYQRWKSKIKRWANGMSYLGYFAYSMVMGPWQAHASALDRGIDSLTIRVRFESSKKFLRDPMIELMQYTEYIIRAISNLHERLHHSITMYLMPSFFEFVSHVEYLLPTILILLPCVVRAVGLLAVDIPKGNGVYFQFSAIRDASVIAGTTFVTQFASSASGCGRDSFLNYILMSIPYLLMGALAATTMSPSTKDASSGNKTNHLQSVQFTICILSVYLHVPVAFAHVSLAYPSALFWTPLLAFASFSEFGKNVPTAWAYRILFLGLSIVSFPPLIIVPAVFASYTPYVRYLYIPLHVQLCFFTLAMWAS